MNPIIFVLSLVCVAIFIVAIVNISITLRELSNNSSRKSDREPDQRYPVTKKHEGMSAGIAALVDAISKDGDATRAEEKREDDEGKIREWFTIGLLALTLGAVGWQVSEMIKVYDPIRDQAQAAKTANDNAARTADAQISEMKAQSVAMAAQVTAMQGQLSEMQREVRPWVTIDDAIKMIKPVTFDDSSMHTAFTATIRNGGKSPALKINMLNSKMLVEPVIPEGIVFHPPEMDAFLMRGLGPVARDCNKNIAEQFTSFAGGFLLPDGVFQWTPTEGPPGLPQPQIKDITIPKARFHLTPDGLTSVWMAACIFYRDASNNLHGTPIVLQYVAEDGSSTFAPKGEIKGTFVVTGGVAPPY